MKKFLSFLLCLVLCFSGAACADSPDNSSGGLISLSQSFLLVTPTDGSIDLKTLVTAPEGATLTWSSSNTEVLPVSQGGWMNVEDVGEAIITVTCGSTSRQISVLSLGGFMFKNSSVDLAVNAEVELSALIDNAELFEFSSSNASVATVSNGNLYTLAAGETVLTASATSFKNNSILSTMDINVYPVELNVSSLDLYEEESAQITIERFGNDGATFASDNETVATINEDGLVTTLSQGSAIITVSYGNNTVNVPVTVRDKVSTTVATNAQIVNAYGRTFTADETGLALFNTATGFELAFTGTRLTMNIDVRTHYTQADWSEATPNIYTAQFAVYLDGATTATKVLSITQTTDYTSVDIVSDITNGNHTVKVMKMNEATENQAIVKEITTDGYFRVPPIKSDRLITFYGDSITAGCNNLAPSGDEANVMEGCEDGMQTYATFACQTLSAVADVHARTGIGLFHGYGFVVQKDVYDKAWCSEYDFFGIGNYVYGISTMSPDAVVVNLGTNDIYKGESNATTFTTEIKSFMSKLFDAYGNDTPIVFCYDALNTGLSDWFTIVENAVASLRSTGKAAYALKLTRHTGGGHPKVENHRINGTALATKLSDLLDW